MAYTRPRPGHVRLAALVAALTATPVILSAGPASSVVGTPVTDTSLAFTAQVMVGENVRGCSGVLIDPEWLVTAASCFVDDPAAGISVPPGAPQVETTATIGRADLTGTGGQVRQVVELVPRTDRDLVMAKLAQPVTDIAPVVVASAAPVAGESLLVGGFGRTADAWVPDKLHVGSFTVESAEATELSLAGSGGSVCRGDTGGPALRVDNGTTELVAINSRSWQGGCYGSDDEAGTGAVDTRVDDLGSWIDQVRVLPKQRLVTSGDFNGDGRTDVAALYDNGVSLEGRNTTSLYTFFSNGTGFAAPVRSWISTGSFTWSKSRLTAGDYNGDGKDDVGILYDTGLGDDGRYATSVYTLMSKGTSFTAPAKTWTSPGNFEWSKSLPTSGDYNGDGKDDIGILYNDGVAADGKNVTSAFSLTSSGSTFKAVKTWTSLGGGFTWSSSKPTSGDYNGDGKDDIGILYNSGQAADGKYVTSAFSLISNGSAFTHSKTWTSPGNFEWSKSLPTSGDYNGDGKDDIGILYDGGVAADGKQVTVAFSLTSSGSAFTAVKTWTSSGSFTWSKSLPTSGDYNGDGKDDIGILYDAGTEPDGRKHDALYFLSGAGTARSWWNGIVI